MVVCCEQGFNHNNDNNNRRVYLIDQIRRFVNDIELEEHCRPRGRRRTSDCRGLSGMSNMDLECREFLKRRDCTPPTITAISVHETRPTTNYTEMKHENNSHLTYIDASSPEAKTPMPPAPWELPRTPSQELRASNLYVNCECLKRNGLQLDCPRWECGGRPECVAINPGPCCEPSKARKPVRGDHRTGGHALCMGGAYGGYSTTLPDVCNDPLPSANCCSQFGDQFMGMMAGGSECVTPPPHLTGFNDCYQGHITSPQTIVSQWSGGGLTCFCTPSQSGQTNYNTGGGYLQCCDNQVCC